VTEALSDKLRRRQALLPFDLFLAAWALSAWHPRYPADWWLENALVFAALPLLLFIWWRAPLSRAGWFAVFGFLCLHELGAHFTYAEVPYDSWARTLTGGTVNGLFGWERNHYDRLVHFLYGVLIVVPLRDLIVRGSGLSGGWSYVVPTTFMMSTSLLYELIEWAAAEIFGGDLGMAYLGTQGDEWDGHRDMALASLGAFLAMTIAYFLSRRRARAAIGREAEELV
jgi:putative membrane protein